VYTLLETPASPDMQAKLFLTDDPALVVLYAQLRQKTLQTLRGASKITPKIEWAFVMHNARLYDRMGCDLLALDLGMLPSVFQIYILLRVQQYATGSSSYPYPMSSRILQVLIRARCSEDDLLLW
jgi:hypothetical protein